MAGSRSHHSDCSKNSNLGEFHKVQKSQNNAQEMYLVLGNTEEDNSCAKSDIMGEEIRMLFKTDFDATHANTTFAERVKYLREKAKYDVIYKKETRKYQRQEQHSGISLFHTCAEVAGGWKSYDKQSPHPCL